MQQLTIDRAVQGPYNRTITVTASVWAAGSAAYKLSRTFAVGANHSVVLDTVSRTTDASLCRLHCTSTDTPVPPTAQTQLQMAFNMLWVRGTNNDWGTTPMALVDHHLWRAVVDFAAGRTAAFKVKCKLLNERDIASWHVHLACARRWTQVRKLTGPCRTAR